MSESLRNGEFWHFGTQDETCQCLPTFCVQVSPQPDVSPPGFDLLVWPSWLLDAEKSGMDGMKKAASCQCPLARALPGVAAEDRLVLGKTKAANTQSVLTLFLGFQALPILRIRQSLWWPYQGPH